MSACSGSIELVASEPWEYALFLKGQTMWILSVPYADTSFVDKNVSLQLSDKEVERFRKDPQWLIQFADEVRGNLSRYRSRYLDQDITLEFHKQKK